MLNGLHCAHVRAYLAGRIFRLRRRGTGRSEVAGGAAGIRQTVLTTPMPKRAAREQLPRRRAPAAPHSGAATGAIFVPIGAFPSRFAGLCDGIADDSITVLED